MSANGQLTSLIAAFELPIDSETIKSPFSLQQWEALFPFLTAVNLVESEMVFQRGREERSLYFVESGRVTIHYQNTKGALRMAMVSPGNIFGEASFLGNIPRQASAQVAKTGRAWVLSRLKFTEMHKRQPELALDVIQFAATNLAKRSRDARRRRAIA